MAEMTVDELYQAASRLSPSNQITLANRLMANASQDWSEPLTREIALAELEELRAANAFEGQESLFGKYGPVDIDADDLAASIRESGKQWEQDVDRLFNAD